MAKRKQRSRAEELPPTPFHPTRREFLLYVGAALTAAACGDDGEGAPPPDSGRELPSNPFLLGVASGDPLAESVILWTRLAMDPINGGGMPDERIAVSWEVALDAQFRTIVRSGVAHAVPALAHSVHVDAAGLAPDTWYWYRFRAGRWSSPIGRTRTLPAVDSSPERFVIALASCQNYKDGYYHAHRYLAEEDIDLVTFVGDYIYESGVAGNVRDHDGPLIQTLAGYRNRYALYKSDPHLQAAHRRAPWVVTWDDHEVRNNYANLIVPGLSETAARELRAAGYQAYYEHMPLRITPPDDFTDMRIYRSLVIGDLAQLCVLDTRQYRDPQPCDGAPGRCPSARDPGRTILGAAQKQWLKDELGTSTALWNVIAQQVVFAPVDFGGSFINPDQWDGYDAERQELIDVFARYGNLLVLTGDIHAAGFARLHATPRNAASPRIGYEVVGTSIASGGDIGNLGPLADAFRDRHDWVEYINAVKRGYALCTLSRTDLRVEFRTVTTVVETEAELTTDAAFVVPRLG
jgi:alkaline phosphatase D